MKSDRVFFKLVYTESASGWLIAMEHLVDSLTIIFQNGVLPKFLK